MGEGPGAVAVRGVGADLGGEHSKQVSRVIPSEQTRTDHLRWFYEHLGTMLEGGAPVPGYLLWTNNEASVLIDTGYRTDTFDEDLDVDRMSRLGVNPADVHYR